MDSPLNKLSKWLENVLFDMLEFPAISFAVFLVSILTFIAVLIRCSQ